MVCAMSGYYCKECGKEISEDEYGAYEGFCEECFAENYLGISFKGIRVQTLRKFLIFAWLLKERFKSLDWGEWKSRDIEKRSKLNKYLSNYLSFYDKEEIEYFKEQLGCSERLVYDYWNTMRELLYMLGIL